MSDDDLIRRVAAAMWKAEAVDAGTPQSVADGRTPKAFEEQSDYIRARWTKFARAAIAAIPATPTFTAADLERAWQPIETAPMDGTRVLAYWPDYSCQVESWFGPWLGEMVWQNEFEWARGHNSPTHWMPLPEPPADLAQRVKEG